MVSRRKKTQKVNRSGANQRVTRNPADVRAGIDAGRIGKNSEAQRTQSRAEAEQEKKRPGSTMQDRIRATNRADPSSKGDTQRRVDARNIRRGFPTGETPLRPTVGTPRDTASIPEESQPFRGTAFDSDDPLGLQNEQSKPISAPFGFIKDADGNSRPATQSESGQAAEFTPGDFLDVASLGGGVVLGGTRKVGTSAAKSVFTNKFFRQNYDEFLDFFIKKAGGEEITEGFIRNNYDEALDLIIKKGNAKEVAEQTIASFTTAGNKAVATGGQSVSQSAKAASGEIVSRFGTAAQTKVATNTATVKKTMTYFDKMVKATLRPERVAGMITTMLGVLAYTSVFWGPNEKGDALTSLGLAQKVARESGNYELVLEIDEAIQETETIRASIPVVGFVQAEIAKFNALRITSKANKEASIREQAETDPQSVRDQLFRDAETARNERQDIRDQEFKDRANNGGVQGPPTEEELRERNRLAKEREFESR